jgi:predicted Zn-dependent protease
LKLSELTRRDLRSMLADLPLALARAQRVDEGAELALTLSFIDPAHFLGDRAILLAEAGRKEQALEQVTDNLASLPGDAWVQIKAAKVHSLLDDPARAEALVRAALTQPTDDATRDSAVDGLLELLDGQGRSAEAKALLAAERGRLDALVRARSETVQRALPKVGRNDPCPCGSGKKHKKCCWQ